jgi:hypothetical protein
MSALHGIDVAAELQQVTDHWSPRVVARVNDQYVNPIAEEEVETILIETVTTAHTGDVVVEGTVPVEQQLGDFRS